MTPPPPSTRCCLDVLQLISGSSSLSESTKLRHEHSLKLLLSNEDNPKDLFRTKLLCPTKSFAQLRRRVHALSTLHTVMIGVLSALRHVKQACPAAYQRHQAVIGQWYGLAAKVAAAFRSSREANKMTPRQKLSNVQWTTVVQKTQALGRTEFGSKDHLLLAMYSMLPPRRQMDYFRVILSADRDPDASGFIRNIHGSQPCMVITKFKTAKFMSDWTKELPNKLVRIIRASLDQTPRRYLFVQSDNAPFDSVNSFTQFTNRVLKKHLGQYVTLNSLRHSFATFVHHQKHIDASSVAYDMAHSLDMHKSYVFLDDKKR
jgi:integrase